MSDYSHNASNESPASSTYRGPTSPTLVNTPLEEFPPPQPAILSPHPRVPRLLTPAPHAPVSSGALVDTRKVRLDHCKQNGCLLTNTGLLATSFASKSMFKGMF